MLIDISDRKIAQGLAVKYCKTYKIYSCSKYDFICEYFLAMMKQDKYELTDLIEFTVKNGDIKIEATYFFRKYIDDLDIVRNKDLNADDDVVYTNDKYSLVEVE